MKDQMRVPDGESGEPTADDGTTTTPEWVVLIDAHLRRAAALAIEHGVGAEGFNRACGIVYDESDPEQRLRNQLDDLRQHGHIGSA
jgi:hypothetical protein